jgi:hypothetical protein
MVDGSPGAEVGAILNRAGIGVGVFPALRQGGTNYLPDLALLVNSSFVWVSHGLSGLEAADFRTVAPARIRTSRPPARPSSSAS